MYVYDTAHYTIAKLCPNERQFLCFLKEQNLIRIQNRMVNMTEVMDSTRYQEW